LKIATHARFDPEKAIVLFDQMFKVAAAALTTLPCSWLSPALRSL
jgi:hypothetical protein